MKEIDAQNKTIGRVASEAAMSLMGKDTPEYTPNKIPEGIVHITNASKISITEKKKGEKEYASYSEYPGGLKYTKLSKILDEKGIEEVLRRAVKGMLPKNRLQAQMLKNLKVSE